MNKRKLKELKCDQKYIVALFDIDGGYVEMEAFSNLKDRKAWIRDAAQDMYGAVALSYTLDSAKILDKDGKEV